MVKLKDSIKETKNNLIMSWSFVKKKKNNLIIMAVLSIALSVISVIIPILSANLLLKLTNNLLEELLQVALIIFIVECSRNIISYFFHKMMHIYMVKTVADVQIEMFSEVLKIEISEIDRNSSGTFIDRIKNDTNDIINIFSNLISYFIDLISNVGILIAIFIISPVMFFYFLFTSIIIGLINRKARNIYYEQNKKYRKLRERTTGLASEFIRGVRDVKLLDGKNGILDRTCKEINVVNDKLISINNTDLKYSLLSGSIRNLFDVTFIILVIILIYNDYLTISNALVLHMYRGRVENLLNFYNRFIDLIKKYNLSATRVFELLGDYFQKENMVGITLDNVKGKIEFKNVSFAYDSDLVLDDVNFKIMPGERIGFVGSSGSGKSTIFNLITKLYHLEKGNIYIDDIDINDISSISLRNNLALIPQNPYIFNFSILDNLKIANTNVTMDDVVDVCCKANIYDRIMEFDNKFDALVGEGGVVLSGGERQRLAIARSLLKKSNILLFDEATSALDNITQDQVQKAIYGLDREKTILIIAHRLSTVVNCDRIVVIDEGKILDIGSHTELLDRCSKYQELFKYEEVDTVK